MEKTCPRCQKEQPIISNGHDRDGTQRFLCKGCNRTFTERSKPKAPGKKTPRKGVKSLPGRPEDYDERKGKVCIVLTPTGLKGLDTMAQANNVSRSELIERFGRGLFPGSDSAAG